MIPWAEYSLLDWEGDIVIENGIIGIIQTVKRFTLLSYSDITLTLIISVDSDDTTLINSIIGRIRKELQKHRVDINVCHLFHDHLIGAAEIIDLVNKSDKLKTQRTTKDVFDENGPQHAQRCMEALLHGDISDLVAGE